MRRRDLLTLPAAVPLLLNGAPDKRRRVAAVVTEYRWYSHADVVCGRLLTGYSANNVWTPSRSRIVSLYRAQTPRNTDMSGELAARNGFKIFPDIRSALTMGTDKLAVDAVVFVGEHGDYPSNAEGQKLYPRYELFSQILETYESVGKGLPTFFDKHFSYEWKKAEEMFRRSRKLGFPLLAGSSIPVTVRDPSFQPAMDTPITEAVALGYGGLDAYGFHLLETLHCMIERRKGGESGVAEVEMLRNADVWNWLGSGQGGWAKPLLDSMRKHYPALGDRPWQEQAKDAAVIVCRFVDGLKTAAFVVNPGVDRWSVSLRIPSQAEPVPTLFGPAGIERPLPHFDGLVRCIDEMFSTGREPYPPERTLLTTGVLALAFDSLRARKRLQTPQLAIKYRANKDAYFQTA